MGLLRAFSLAGLPSVNQCDDIGLTVDGAPVWVERHGDVALARLAIDGPVSVTVQPATRVDWLDIRPRSRCIRAEWEWNRVSFTLPGPDKLWIELPELPPLIVVASGPAAVQSPRDATRVLGPGAHDEPELKLESDDVVWLDGDALVRGGVVGSPHRAKLAGPGVIDAGCLERPRKVVELVDAEDVLIDGPVLRAGPCWQNAFIRCRNATLRNATVISHGRNGDGIDVVASSGVRIEKCFFRCSDDCISLKCNVDPRFMPAGVEVNRGNIQDLHVSGCTMVGWQASDGFTIGFEARGDFVRDIRVEDCDILYARGHSCANGHSAFSIICDGPARVENVRFERLRVEENVFKNFELYVTHGGYYVKDGPGAIENIVLHDIEWAADRPIVLKGHAEGHAVRHVRFDHCRVAGRSLSDAQSADVRIGGHVEDISFVAGPDLT